MRPPAALLAFAAFGLWSCGTPPTTSTADASVDAPLDGSRVDALDPFPGVDSGVPEVASHGLTTGMPCATSAECDVTGEGVNICSQELFSFGTSWPNPVCVGRTCEVAAFFCDGGKGICTDQGMPVCLPTCRFRGDGTPIAECVGRAACSTMRLDKDAKGGVGLGFCKPACRDDAECTRGDRCQRETGVCMKSIRTYTKVVGEVCKGGSTECRCNVSAPSQSGYCTSSCVAGDPSGCPAGFVCNTSLLPVDPADGTPLFTLDPPGLGGLCAKSCTKDADCTQFGAFRCEVRTSGKVCLPS